MAATDDYRIYGDLASWWRMISPPEEYAMEAAYLAAMLRSATAAGQSGTAARMTEVLDLGCGGGHVAAYLKDEFSLTLVDISDHMLAVSKQLNPACVHVQGDMRTVRLNRGFDAVLVHDAIDYIIGSNELRQVIGTAAAHCRPGGIALFVPDYVEETFSDLTGAGGGGVDLAGRTASFTERTWDPDPDDDWVQADYEFTLREADGNIQTVHETHRLSAFSRDLWLSLLSDSGFEPVLDLDYHSSAAGRRPANLFIGRRRPAT
jgi:SAM-dependent methyltransferase